MKHFDLAKMACLALVLCLATAIASPAQTFKRLASFNITNGSSPLATLVQGLNGNLYGMTPSGGTGANCPLEGFGCGTVFEIGPTGKLTTIYSFCSQPNCTDGWVPDDGLLLASDGNFYGTTNAGGTNCLNVSAGCGTVFKITPAGILTTLYNFCAQANCTDGRFPMAGLVQGDDGNFYGTTTSGGASGYFGTAFKITPTGQLTTLHSFCAETNCIDGAVPSGQLLQAANGNLYGLTYEGGTDIACLGGTIGCGTFYEITPAGKWTLLHNFAPADGELLQAGVIQAADGNFYDTSMNGGTSRICGGSAGCGTVFKINSAGELTTLYNFCNQAFCNDGAYPAGALVQATDGNFYGTISAFGPGGLGTIFKITSDGKLTTLHSFGVKGGYQPDAGLVQATDGNFYGTANAGGPNNEGTIFSLSVGLSPFVETVPASGWVGDEVIILGNNLTGTTNVSFDGFQAKFTVASSTEITAVVPGGAATGKVEVLTPTGLLESNVVFRVTPKFKPPAR